MTSLPTIKAARRQVAALMDEALASGSSGDHLALQVALDCMAECEKAHEAAIKESCQSEWLSDRMSAARDKVFGPLSCVQRICVIGGT